MTAINAEVTQNEEESGTSVLRRFTKRVQGSGILPHIRARRFFERPQSKYRRKAHALKRLERREFFRELFKLGKTKDASA